jgi:hypothetical protein
MRALSSLPTGTRATQAGGSRAGAPASPADRPARHFHPELPRHRRLLAALTGLAAGALAVAACGALGFWISTACFGVSAGGAL